MDETFVRVILFLCGIGIAAWLRDALRSTARSLQSAIKVSPKVEAWRRYMQTWAQDHQDGADFFLSWLDYQIDPSLDAEDVRTLMLLIIRDHQRRWDEGSRKEIREKL